MLKQGHVFASNCKRAVAVHISCAQLHSSGAHHFPVSDYNVFWRRQPRKWDFIECGNHPEMHPGQIVPYQGPQVLFSRSIPQNQKHRPKSEDTFNRWWEVPPWEHDTPGQRIHCTLNTQENGVIEMMIDRPKVEMIDADLRCKCTMYNLYVRSPAKLSMTPHQIIHESWKYYAKPNDIEAQTEDATAPTNYYLERFKARNELYKESTLATQFVQHYQVFLKDLKRRMIFDDVESLHFEQYVPDQATFITIPCRFYGLDQWYPINRDGFFQWKAPRKNDRPRYVQHEYEIEFQWDGKDIYKIPRHLSITVEQFCLPWKTEITLADVKLPDNLTPLKDPHDIKILSLDFSKMKKQEATGRPEEEEEEIDLLSPNFG